MSTEENKAKVLRWTEEGWNHRNWAVFDELAASNWIIHDPSFPQVCTLEDYKRWASETCNAFPDNQVTIDGMVAEGDQVAMRCTLRGTNTGDFVTPMLLPATGKQVTMTAMVIVRFAGGKGVEVWQVGDTLGMFQQLGVIPAPGQAG